MPEEIMVYGSAEALLAEDALSAVAFEPNEGQRTLLFPPIVPLLHVEALTLPAPPRKGGSFCGMIRAEWNANGGSRQIRAALRK